MNKIAVFGKPGGGKSTFSRKFAKKHGLPLYPLDLIEYHRDGSRVDASIFESTHDSILESDSWVIEGFGTYETFMKRLDYADTLIYIHLPYSVHYWWVIKRLLISAVVKPEGWPQGSSVLKGTINSFKTLKLCPKFWNQAFLDRLHDKYPKKSIYVFRNVDEMNGFLHSADRVAVV